MGTEALPVGALADDGRKPRLPALVERLRGVHHELLGAVLAGEGLERVAQLTAAHVGAPVAIVVPAQGIEVGWPAREVADKLPALRRYSTARATKRQARIPDGTALLVPVTSGEVIGSVSMLAEDAPAAPEAGEFLHLAALATVTSLALEQARQPEGAGPAASLIEDLRRGGVEAEQVVVRAARLGCELTRGAVATVTEARTTRPRQAVALIPDDYPGAIAEVFDGRIYAVLPARGGDDAPELSLTAARGLAQRLRSYGPTGISSFYTDPSELQLAIQEAELVLEVVARDERMADQLTAGAGSGVYRLLFRALASHPEEVRSFYEDTVAPLVRYDDQYRTDLLATLEAYLANDCNMNATARSIYAHRHTVAYRLQRIRELSGLDPMISEDRERLGLGLKAFKIVAPTLPR